MNNISVTSNYSTQPGSPVDSSTHVNKATVLNAGDLVPQVNNTSGKQKELWDQSLPIPQLPPNKLDLNVLFSALEEKDRREGISQAITNTKINGERRIDVLNDRLEKLQEAADKEEKGKSVGILGKILGWIGAVVGIVASVATTIATAGASTGLLVASIVGLVASVGSMVQQIGTEASGGKYQPGFVFSKILQACGVPEEKASMIGGIINTVMMTALSLGSGIGALCKAPKAIAQSASEIAKVVTKICTVVEGVGGLVDLGAGAANIASASYAMLAGLKRAENKELEAILEEIRARDSMDISHIEKMLEDLNQNTGVVREIIQSTQEANLSVMTVAPQMA